jgi:hypothetical protein
MALVALAATISPAIRRIPALPGASVADPDPVAAVV